jgi:hypothetical protein
MLDLHGTGNVTQFIYEHPELYAWEVFKSELGSVRELVEKSWQLRERMKLDENGRI